MSDVFFKIRKSMNQKGKEPNKLKQRAKVAFTCMVLLGLTWIFGLFAIGRAAYTFHLLFCIFNAFQGK